MRGVWEGRRKREGEEREGGEGGREREGEERGGREREGEERGGREREGEEGRERERGRERREVGGEEDSQRATSHNHETSTPVRPCPPAGYGTLAHGSTPPSQMLYACVRREGLGGEGGRRR